MEIGTRCKASLRRRRRREKEAYRPIHENT